MVIIQKGCESCRKWQEHCYWEHMDASKIRFFKLMTGDFARRISTPEKFAKNFNGSITRGLDLKVPSGETWHIGVDKRGDLVFLVLGWKDFVKAYELKENDLLIFTCSGSSSFEVLIFDANGCEKVSSLFGNRIGHTNMCGDFKDMAGQSDDHYSRSDSDDTSMPTHHKASTSKRSGGKNKPRKEPASPDSSEEDEREEECANSNYYYSMVADHLTYEEKEEILSMASIGPGNPAFVTVLQKAQFQRRNNSLTIPVRFAADHLGEREHDIILRRPNRKEKHWPVRYYYSPTARSFRNLRLFNFMRENELREGDICIFELMKGARKVNVMMTVHVARRFHGRFVLVG